MTTIQSNDQEVNAMTNPPQRTALVQISPGADERVAALYQEGVALQQYAIARTIQSDADVKNATDDLTVIAGVKRAIEDRRREYVGPLNDYLKAVNDAFKTFAEPLGVADALTRSKVLDYRKEQERIRQEQERINRLRLEAAQAEMRLKGELTEAVNTMEVAPAPPARYRTDIGTLGVAETWKFEVVSFYWLPNDYKLPDNARIRKAVEDGATIPGVRAWKEEGLRITAARLPGLPTPALVVEVKDD